MSKITSQDISTIVSGYKDFIADLSESTIKQYADIVKLYLKNEALSVVDSDDYESIFTEDKLANLPRYRKNNIGPSALNNLKNYLIKEGKLNRGFDFNFPPIEEKKKADKELIPLDTIQNIILGTNGKFRSPEKEEKVITQCLSAMSYYCIFEQKHILKLKCSDILIDEQRIRNIRVDSQPNEVAILTKWIHLDEEITQYIVAYIDYFEKDMFSDELFFILPDGNNIANKNIVHYFSNYEFKDNGSLSVGCQGLNYSRIYHYLVATKGRGVADILPIVGLRNKQLEDALKDYISDYGILHNLDSIVTLLSVANVAKRYDEAERNYYSRGDCADEEKLPEKSEWIATCNTYSEENDINMNDVELYDSMSKNNQQSKGVELSRLVRSTYLAELLKLAYKNRCQLCGTRLMKSRSDAYSEAHHIKPYNKTHKGDDTISNMVVLCPNCHSQFDNLYYAIHPNTRLVHCVDENDRFHLTEMQFIREHTLGENYLTYTWNLFEKM